jgi:hypothetical protein
MCTNNSNCNCTDNTCGCKTSTDEVVYQGPPLTCVGINNCDTITQVLQQLNSYICSEELVTIIINNIINNVDLYQQFTTIVNNSVNCETVWGCETTTTTTTTLPLSCNIYKLASTGPSDFPEDFDWEAIECYSGDLIKGNLLTYPTSVNTICALEDTLVLGSKVEILSVSSCTTTTTTTILI